MIPALKRTEAPPGLLFHLGHTWVLPGNEEAVVGIDSFAARLLPCATAVKLVCGGRLLKSLPLWRNTTACAWTTSPSGNASQPRWRRPSEGSSSWSSGQKAA
ncbi:MAG: hypothetical protein H8E31_09760 [Planctomycetes bacterium]|nr:hypothetical protein [Planctomycetota bacterium]